MIDDQTLKKYQHFKGPFPQFRLHNDIDWKQHVFRQYNRRCAFLNEENLCDIYTEAGPEMFCRTCRNYPRHIEEFEGLREISLSDSPVRRQARILLSQKEKVHFITKEKKAKEEKREDEEMAFIHRFIRRVKERGFLYDERDLYNFHISAKSSRLVILAGRSGTGKSGLVRLYGETLGLSPSQIAFLPVRPSWMDDGDLLGYLDRNRMLYFPIRYRTGRTFGQCVPASGKDVYCMF